MVRGSTIVAGAVAPAFLALCATAIAQPTLVATINEPTVTADSHFGWAIGTDGFTLGVANRRVISAGVTQNTVYLYEDGTSGWSLVKTLTGFTTSDRVWEIVFDDDTLAISDKRSDIYDTDGGIVWMYQRDSTTGLWPSTPTQTLAPPASPDTCQNFGQSIAIDGDLMVVSAHGRYNGSGERTGWAYAYQRDNASSPWHLVGDLDPGFTNSYLVFAQCALTLEVPRFGTSVATDNGRFVISAAGADHGGSPGMPVADKDWGFLAYVGSDLLVSNPGTDPVGSPAPFEEVLEFGPATIDTYGQQIAMQGSLIAIGNRGKTGTANEGVLVYYGDGGSPEQWTTTPVVIADPNPGTGASNIAGKMGFSEDLIITSTNSWNTPELPEAYVFRRNMGGCEGWGLVAELTDPDMKPTSSPLPGIGGGLANKRGVEIVGRTVFLAGAWDDIGSDTFAGSVYIYTIPDCPGDIDGDLDADSDDLDSFATLFLASDPAADVDCDSDWDLDDIDAFVDMFLLGCS
ncbi:MAG: hypothetical protein DHS20C14_14520 [Phycisphaeraceae bacterium]|nr:MAG: hypothetical protein DHS20C14_14520 [Phycisphaeraceae bacterium]